MRSKRKAAMLAPCCLALALAQSACAVRIAGEDLGGGFTRVRSPLVAVSSPEGQTPTDHLYYRRADLGAVDFVSVAPSGSHAIFARNGEIFLIASRTGKLGPVTDGEYSLPAHVGWHEREGFAEIVYAADRPSSRIELK